MKKPVFEGAATAIVTPFNEGTIDFPVMIRLLDLQLAAGVDAGVVCGTTGEASTMTDNEKLALIAHTVKYCAGRCKISLYKKKECIEKNIPEEEAVEKLIELIRDNGDYIEK